MAAATPFSEYVSTFHEKESLGSSSSGYFRKGFHALGNTPFLLAILKNDPERHKHKVPVPTLKCNAGNGNEACSDESLTASHFDTKQQDSVKIKGGLPTLLTNTHVKSILYTSATVSEPTLEAYVSAHLGQEVSALYYRAVAKDSSHDAYDPQKWELARLHGRDCVGGMLVCACIDGDLSLPSPSVFDDKVNWFGSDSGWFGSLFGSKRSNDSLIEYAPLKGGKVITGGWLDAPSHEFDPKPKQDKPPEQPLPRMSMTSDVPLWRSMRLSKTSNDEQPKYKQELGPQLPENIPLGIPIDEYAVRQNIEVQKCAEAVDMCILKAKDAATQAFNVAEDCRRIEEEIKQLIMENEGYCPGGI